MALPSDPAARKRVPLATGVLDYFPDALEAVAAVSFAGNEQHNPGKSLHWDRSKSFDHADCALRHFRERGTRDADGYRHTAKLAWRALAMLQLEIEEGEGVPPPRGARNAQARHRDWTQTVHAGRRHDPPQTTAHPLAAEALKDADEAAFTGRAA